MKLHGRVRRGRGVSHFVRQLAERTHARSAESHVSFTPQLRSGLSVAFRIHPVRNSVSNGVHPRANARSFLRRRRKMIFSYSQEYENVCARITLQKLPECVRG